MATILQSDTVTDTASKIYNEFEINQSCKIVGFVKDGKGELRTRGEMVLEELERLDMEENTYKSDGKPIRRKRVKPDNSIGDFVAQKMFIWKAVDTHKFTIWRRQ